ncbi:MAG: HAD hydrolase-like protein [Candidatus Aenigmarchaeota archaeon]|nr:HAD hydrolase-like protein [Candidatus Aenigmarchaeota archaeon]
MKKLLIFDYDGVIVDSLDMMVKVVNKLCRSCNFKHNLSKEEVAALFDVNFFEGMKKLGIDKKEVKKYSHAAMDFLKENGLEPYVEEIIGIEKEASKVKKVEYCKRKYNVENEFIFYIGDTRGDMIEGKKGKIKTVAVTWGYYDRRKLEKENPDFIVDSPNNLLNLFL